ncbi:MAG: hypothetical protein CFE32_21010 [Alphaproteobacteria bacterium PA3]|nr:MAG: hypothetical protein CFE32_21010 [Alphaproteobacteria bacterium PA3]
MRPMAPRRHCGADGLRKMGHRPHAWRPLPSTLGPPMTDALLTSLEALAALLPDGASVTVHKGDEPDVPMALAKALVRRGARGLHIVTLPTALIGAGCVDSVETSGISLHELGAAPRFTKAVKAGTLKVLDATCPAVYAGLNAGAKGQPFELTLRMYNPGPAFVKDPKAAELPVLKKEGCA